MHEGRTQPVVRLAQVVPGPHAWGLGALGGLDGEVTIVDDVLWLARPMPDGTASITHGPIDTLDKEQGAALLVVANVAAWHELDVATAVSWQDLDTFLEGQLVALGHPIEAPVALRIDGTVASLRWHVVDGSKLEPGAGHADHARSAVSGVLERVDAQVVGFFSRGHQGIFTHAGSHSHFHVVTTDGKVTGHVDAMDLVPGSSLRIARR
jgi:acetolactate decarboxylase